MKQQKNTSTKNLEMIRSRAGEIAPYAVSLAMDLYPLELTAPVQSIEELRSMEYSKEEDIIAKNAKKQSQIEEINAFGFILSDVSLNMYSLIDTLSKEFGLQNAVYLLEKSIKLAKQKPIQPRNYAEIMDIALGIYSITMGIAKDGAKIINPNRDQDSDKKLTQDSVSL